MINKTLIIFAILISNVALAQNDSQGYIYNVKLEIDERLREKIPEKNFNGYTGAKDSNGDKIMIKGIYDGNEINEILDKIAVILQSSTSVDTVMHVSAQKKNIKKALGSLGEDIINEDMLDDRKEIYYTLDYFPSVGIKKAIKSKSKEYYDVKIKIIWGGNASDMIVMNKVKKKAYVKYRINISISTKGPNKKKMWKKKGSFYDFTETIDGSIGKKYFKIVGTQKLSLENIEKSVLIAINQLIN